MTIIVDERLSAYLDDLVRRAAGAVDVQRVSVRFADGSKPRRSRCHANVERWVAENPGSEAVRGWLISAQLGPAILLDAHSVVRRRDGELMDITLTFEDQRAPFIEHSGAESEFQEVRERFNQIAWPPAPLTISQPERSLLGAATLCWSP
ncbi:MAG TPA: hypothetical protein VF650_17360 [Allosphingosinicella sp.]|jgi:hypothetical protein